MRDGYIKQIFNKNSTYLLSEKGEKVQEYGGINKFLSKEKQEKTKNLFVCIMAWMTPFTTITTIILSIITLHYNSCNKEKTTIDNKIEIKLDSVFINRIHAKLQENDSGRNTLDNQK